MRNDITLKCFRITITFYNGKIQDMLTDLKFKFFFIFLFLNFATPIYAIDITLQWTPNNESNLAGYTVFCRQEGQSYQYTRPYWETTNSTCTIYDLDETITYCFVVRAFSTDGFESDDSKEVCLEAATASSGSGDVVDIEAEDMPIKTTGGLTSDGWNIWSNGYIADNLNFATGGNVSFEVAARGSYAGGAWPIMEVRIDQIPVRTVTVNASDWAAYTVQANITPGMHEVAIAFINDYYKPPNDRNLYVDKVSIQ